jgi:hypothetical protein
VEIVIAQGRKDANVLLIPQLGFTVIHLPIIGIISVVRDVTAEGDEVRMNVGNSLHKFPACVRIGCLSVRGIGKACISIGDEVHALPLFEEYICRRRLRQCNASETGKKGKNPYKA